LAFCIDLVAGDPRWLYHPVRVIGSLAMGIEKPLRKIFGKDIVAGFAAVVIVLAATGGATWLMLYAADYFGKWVLAVVSVLIVYTSIAMRDLASHSGQVYKALAKGDIALARKRVAMIVGRDTDKLGEDEIIRATVESVAEGTVDGITAPLFYAIIAGPIGAMVYKAVNTLDSTFGYMNDRYVKFGYASAKLDDIANYIPARITGPLMCLAAGLVNLRVKNAFKVMRSDSRNHTSPNSGFTEAAIAGAMSVQLGGVNDYSGVSCSKPTIGQPIETLRKEHIKKANMLMFLTTVLFIAICLGLRICIAALWHSWRTSS
jgi:adenosylcobinamide-phosphate synthase